MNAFARLLVLSGVPVETGGREAGHGGADAFDHGRLGEVRWLFDRGDARDLLGSMARSGSGRRKLSPAGRATWQANSCMASLKSRKPRPAVQPGGQDQAQWWTGVRY